MNIKRLLIEFVVFLALGLAGHFEYMLVRVWINGSIEVQETNRALLAAEIVIFFIVCVVCVYALREVIRDKTGIRRR